MAYQLKAVTVRTNNTNAGLAQIRDLWQDVFAGKIPILCDSKGAFLKGACPVSQYSRYESDETGSYDFSILTVEQDFFEQLEEAVRMGTYIKYEAAAESPQACTKKAWQAVWKAQQERKMQRSFIKDFESAVSTEYSKDGMAHCSLYIGIQ